MNRRNLPKDSNICKDCGKVFPMMKNQRRSLCIVCQNKRAKAEMRPIIELEKQLNEWLYTQNFESKHLKDGERFRGEFSNVKWSFVVEEDELVFRICTHDNKFKDCTIRLRVLDQDRQCTFETLEESYYVGDVIFSISSINLSR